MRLLTILSALAGWSLLGVLMAGLYAILEPLKRVRRSLERIAMGVRAIEQETAPLGGHIEAVAATLGEAGRGFGAVAGRLGDVDRDLDGAVPALRRAR
jgi:hypothetical protein